MHIKDWVEQGGRKFAVDDRARTAIAAGSLLFGTCPPLRKRSFHYSHPPAAKPFQRDRQTSNGRNGSVLGCHDQGLHG